MAAIGKLRGTTPFERRARAVFHLYAIRGGRASGSIVFPAPHTFDVSRGNCAIGGVSEFETALKHECVARCAMEKFDA